jgi:hypothetical protein
MVVPTAPVLSPADRSAGVPYSSLLLGWYAGAATSFDLYFGATTPPPLQTSNAGSFYTAANLNPCTTYYWQVVAHNANGSTPSAIYSFTTTPVVTLDSNAATLSVFGGTGTIQVTAPAGCQWNVSAVQTIPPTDAEGNPPPRQTITVTPASGTGNGVVTYSVPQNPFGIAYTFRITIGDKQFTLQQQTGILCPVTITPNQPAVDATAQSLQLAITTNPGCSWNASTGAGSGFTISGPASGTGTGSITVSVTANTIGITHAAVITVSSFPIGTTVDTLITQRQTVTTFSDVPPSYPTFDAINLLWGKAITAGCSASPLSFCPDANITRGQMAVFIVRAAMGSDDFTYATTPYFSDVPASHQFFKWIQKLRDLKITAGCSTTQYCPDSSVTQAQMAVFVTRSRLGATYQFTYPTFPMFADVPPTHQFFSWIQKMGQLGINSGCAVGVYCPDDPVTRGQMAALVMRGDFNQLLPTTTPVVTSVTPTAAPRGFTALVTIKTANVTFTNPSLLQVTAGDGVAVSNISVVNATTLTALFTVLPDAVAGPRSVIVTGGSSVNPAEATLPNGFLVQ